MSKVSVFCSMVRARCSCIDMLSTRVPKRGVTTGRNIRDSSCFTGTRFVCKRAECYICTGDTFEIQKYQLICLELLRFFCRPSRTNTNKTTGKRIFSQCTSTTVGPGDYTDVSSNSGGSRFGIDAFRFGGTRKTRLHVRDYHLQNRVTCAHARVCIVRACCVANGFGRSIRPNR